jgi:hypothetical protein
MEPALLLPPMLASDAAGFTIFGIFVVAIVVLIVLTIRWTIRRDRELRQDWRRRQAEAGRTPYGIVPKGYEEDTTAGGDPGPTSST